MGLNVLLVDDSAVMRSMILKSLEMGAVPVREVHHAANGAEALALLERQWIDLVVLDISMPVMRGDELLERMRSDPALAALPVLVISSERGTQRVTRMQALGAVYLAKPFLPEQLRELVLELTGVRP